MLKWNGKKVSEQIEKQNRRGVKKACMMLEREIKLAMKSTPQLMETRYKKRLGAGKYKRGAKAGRFVETRFHHPSAPGYPPAVDEGRLIGSISENFSWENVGRGSVSGKAKSEDGVSKPSAGKHESVGVTGSAVEYALPLEFGTSKMEARPYLRSTLIKNQGKIASMFK